MARKTLRNEFVSVSVDERGRIVSLKNRATGTELISHPRAAEAWRMIIPTGRHTIDIIEGSRQPPPRVELVAGDGFHSIIMSYDKIVGSRTWPVEARFLLSLADGSREVSARVEIVNQSEAGIDEVEFPVLGGIGGLVERGGRRVINLVAAGDRGSFYADVLRRGLPDTGEESHHYVRRLETAMFESDRVGGVWLDLGSEREGLLVALCSKGPEFAFKVEKSPKEVPNAPAHRYPPGTSRWLRVWALHVPRIRPGTRWASEPVIVMPHEGDWHGGADRYSAYRHERLRLAEPPAWMADFVGWTEILGKTYLGEVFHDYGQCAQAVARDGRVTGLDLVFYYGHSKLGAEGADFDHSPAPDLGGSEGFHAMVEGLHRSGVRVMLLDHFHRWINRDLPEFEGLGLSRYAVLDKEGRPVTARWWKETFLSCRRLEGPTPVWVEMCPSCEEWLHLYLDHVTEMIELGVDGLELDTFCPSACHNPAHNHPRGADMSGAKIEFMRAVRAHARRLNPDFALVGETMVPEMREVLDGYYSFRYTYESDRIFRYLFPEIREQTVLVGNYAYDQVNKALMLGIGVNTECDGLRSTALAACPELARYIGEVNRFRRRHADLLIRGTFRDTVGARLKGECLYSVIQGTGRGRALVLRNPHDRPSRVEASLPDVKGLCLLLWRPFATERAVRQCPVRLTLRPWEGAVLLALEAGAVGYRES